MLNDALKRLIADLERNEIDYVVIGAIALNQHGYRRFTEDINLILTEDGLRRFRETRVDLGYRPAFSGAKKNFAPHERIFPLKLLRAANSPATESPSQYDFPRPMSLSLK